MNYRRDSTVPIGRLVFPHGVCAHADAFSVDCAFDEVLAQSRPEARVSSFHACLFSSSREGCVRVCVCGEERETGLD